MNTRFRNNAHRLASATRFFSVLVALAVFSSLLVWLRMASPHARVGHTALYGIVTICEWILFGLVVQGSDSPNITLFGSSKKRSRALLWDLLTAACLVAVLLAISPWITALLGKSGWVLTEGMLPHGRLEAAAWVVMAISAGICEETIFRGYLQQQISSCVGSAVAGVLGQALLFGICHAYQGFKNVTLITLWGCIFGVAVYIRKGLGGNMLAHAVLDILSGF